MAYFFTTLIQSLLPYGLLLACAWVFSKSNLKTLFINGLIAISVGLLIGLSLPKGQAALLFLNGISLFILISFLITQWLGFRSVNHLWHFLLLAISAIQWARNPNISAITSTDIINTDFILNLSAVLFGIIFVIFLSAWLILLLRQCKTDQKLTALRNIILLVISLLIILPIVSEIALSLIKLQLLELTKNRLSLMAKVNILPVYSNYILSFLGFILLILYYLKIWLPRKQQKLQQTDPIQIRQKAAQQRNSTRMILWGAFAFTMILGSQLYWDKIASQPLQLSKATEVKLDNQQQIKIAIEPLKDGNLHRFVWIADDGKAVRFFIINRLADKLSLGVVFDACLLCGDQGYVMKDGQVVCVGCEVRMFKPSIGKPGGCNPVPIEDWQQTENEVIIPRNSLEMGLNLFSTIIELEVIDPVDGTKLLNTQSQYKYSFNNKTYFFANEQNLNLFRDQPENYIQGGQ